MAQIPPDPQQPEPFQDQNEYETVLAEVEDDLNADWENEELSQAHRDRARDILNRLILRLKVTNVAIS